MASTVVRFTRGEWLPKRGDLREYSLEYSVVDARLVGKPEEGTQTHGGTVVVGISGSLEAVWSLGTTSLEKVLFEYAKRLIEGKVVDNTLTEHEEILLTTYNAPKKCPYDPQRIATGFGTPFEFTQAQQSLANRTVADDLASRIIDLRDNINAMFGDRCREKRLLALPQERNLLELFRPCRSQEEFAYRLASLCTLVTSIDCSAFKRQVKSADDQKPLDLLGEFLRSRLPKRLEEVNRVMDRFTAFNQLRRRYPIHTDRAAGVLDALSSFGIEYPVSDFQGAWRTLMEAYAQSLGVLLDLVKSF